MNSTKSIRKVRPRGAGRRVPLEGSRPPAIVGARRQPPLNPDHVMEVTVRLRRKERSPEAFERALHDVMTGKRRPLTYHAYAAAFGADPEDVAAIRKWARRERLGVMDVDTVRRSIHLKAPADAIANAFGVERVRYRWRDVTWNSHTGPITLPASVADIITGVLGLDDRPQADRRVHAHIRVASAKEPFTPPEVARIYGFPDELDGREQTIGVIELGGGYKASDLHRFFDHLELPHPRFTAVSVCGARNAPSGDLAGFDGEVTGDIETIGALVPAARIVVYFAPNSARGFIHAVSQAVHDRRHRPSVLSISWGHAEVHWTRQTLRLFNEVLAEAALLGVTVCCSSGDDGAFADALDRKPHVCFPASSPYALACGGTTLLARRDHVRNETVWKDAQGASGGGVSEVFPLPWWQSRSRVPATDTGRRGRGVPDVAANADPDTGYRVFVHGKWCVGAGTSAAAPLWAGLIARINQLSGRPVGLITPFLYNGYADLVRSGAVRPITKGNNGTFRARRGWSCCTGLGAPHGSLLARAIQEAFNSRGL